MKQARALVSQGNKVRIYGRSLEGFPEEEIVDGIEIVRLPVLNYNLTSAAELDIIDTVENLGILPNDVTKELRVRVQRLMEARDAFEITTKSREDIKKSLLPVVEKIVLLKEERNLLVEKIKEQKKAACKTRIGFIRTKTTSVLGLKSETEKKLIEIYRELNKALAVRNQARSRAIEIEKTHPKKEILEKIREEIFYCRHLLYATKITSFDHKIKPDVIHSHDLYPLLGAVLLGKKTGAKVIFDAHEIETERVPPLSPERKNFIDLLERGLLNHAEHVITCCESSTEFYYRRFNKRRPISVMNAPDYNDTPNHSVVDIRELAGIAANTPTIIYTGGVGQEARGMDKAILALKQLDGVHLAILGPRHHKNDQWLLNKATEAGVTERVHFVSSVPAELVVPTIKSADVGICLIQDVSLSYRYAMPNKLFEMTFAEIPIVVSDLPEMGKFIAELENGLVIDQTNPDEISQGIRTILDNKEKYQLKDSGRKLLREKYSWKAQTIALKRAYTEVLGEEHV